MSYRFADGWVSCAGCFGEWLTYAGLLLWHRAAQDGVEEGGDGIRRGRRDGSYPACCCLAFVRIHNPHNSFPQVSQMEIELQGMPQSIKPQYQARIKSAKADLTRFKKLSKDLHAQLTRSDLMGGVGGRPIGPSSADDPYGTSDRTRLLAGTALLEDGTKRLQDSQRIALETEEQGADILSNLRRQREQIENTRDTVRCSLTPTTPPCLVG